MNNPAVTGFYHEESGSIAYVVADPATRHAAIIDPVLDFDEKAGRISTASADAILKYVADNKLSVDWVLDTHPHADHFSAAVYLKEKLGAPAAIGKHIGAVQDLWKAIYNLPDFPADGSQWDRLFADGDTLSVGSLQGRVMHSPGHTLASITYMFGDAAFIHDTLFQPDTGSARCDFPGGSAATHYDSITAHSVAARRDAAVHRSRLQAWRPAGALGIDRRRAEGEQHPFQEQADARGLCRRCAKRATRPCRCRGSFCTRCNSTCAADGCRRPKATGAAT